MNGLAIDYFAGGGGASLGMARAGYRPDIALNHDANAIEMHEANNPDTLHLREDIFRRSPRKHTGGRDVAFVWLSPDCKHFSKAKGGRPVSKKIRGLAWSAVRVAKEAQPSVIVLENVEEFVTWGPLMQKVVDGIPQFTEDGEKVMVPNPAKKGQTFRRFINELKKAGYAVEWRELVAADYGAPTTRKRLYLIARRDGNLIVWPAPSHRDPRKQPDVFNAELPPWRSAAECIDWTIPCPSIFLTKAEASALGLKCKRPLEDATLRRLAAGTVRYVLNNARPFIVPVTHQGAPSRGHSIDEPARTVTGAHRGEMALVAPLLVPRYGERKGQAPRAASIEAPMPTVVPTGNGGSLAAVHLSHFYSSNTRGGEGDLEKPLKTVTAQGGHAAFVTAFLAKHYGDRGQRPGSEAREPLGTVTQVDHHSLVEATLSHDEQKALRVAAFLMTYYGEGLGQELFDPARTVTVRDRLALVTVTLAGGERRLITDICMRMLEPRELARAQGFPDSYILTGTKTSQVARIGNSVCPPVAEAIVRANCPPRESRRAAA